MPDNSTDIELPGISGGGSPASATPKSDICLLADKEETIGSRFPFSEIFFNSTLAGSPTRICIGSGIRIPAYSVSDQMSET
jgi:hypothetical protein